MEGLSHHGHPIRKAVQATSVKAESAICHIPLKEEDGRCIWSKAAAHSLVIVSRNCARVACTLSGEERFPEALSLQPKENSAADSA